MTNNIPRMPEDEITARKAIEAAPHDANTYYNLGFLLAQDSARTGEAEISYRTAIELEPNNARYIYRLALLLHENMRHFGEAEVAYRRAIELAPDDPFYYGGLITLLVQQSRRSEALALGTDMRVMLSARENWYGMATLDAILGNGEEALKYLRLAASEAKFDQRWARNDPDLASIRTDPRFDEIIGSA